MHEFNCQECHKLCNNINGGDCRVQGPNGETKRVCVNCAEKLKAKGWQETTRARGL